MWIRIYEELLVMSIVAGGLYLVFKGLSRWTRKLLTARWNYGIILMVYSFFIVPYHRLVPSVELVRAAGSNETGEGEVTPTVEEFRSGIDPFAEQFLHTDFWQLNLPKDALFPWHDILPWLCMAGTLVFTGSVIVQYCKLHLRIMRTCRPAGQAEMLNALEICKRQLGIKRKIAVYLSPHMTTPFLYGWVRPRIVLPDMPFTANDYHYVFLHELMHYKRRDPWVKLLLLLINAIHWFNPFTYMARRDADRFCEFSCDEKVVKPMDMQERRRYCELILRVLWQTVDRKDGLYPAFGGSKSELERRMTMILDMEASKKKKWVRALALGTTLTMALFGTSIAYASVSSNDQLFNKLPAADGPELDAPVTVVNSDLVPTLRSHSTVNGLGSSDAISILESSETQFLAATPHNGLQSPNPAVSESNAASAAQLSDVEPLATGNLSPGKAYTFDKQKIGKGSIVTINASWTPTDADLQVGLLSHASNTVYYVKLSGGEGSAPLQVNTTGEYSIYVGNPSDSTIKFDVSYIIN